MIVKRLTSLQPLLDTLRMDIRKLYVSITKKILPDAIICDVIGLVAFDKKLIKDELEIIKKLANKSVYIPKICSEVDFETFKVNDILDVSVKEIFASEENQTPRVHHNGVTQAKFKYLVEVFSVHTESNYIALDLIKESLNIEIFDLIDSDFYLSVHNTAYGPLKLSVDKKEIKPSLGKSIFKYKIDLNNTVEHPIHDDLSLLFGEPKEKLDEFDCSSSEQLIEWIKKQLKDVPNHNEYAEKLNKVIKLLNGQSFSGIETTRYERAKTLIEKIELSFEEFENFKNDPAWESVLFKALETHKEKFKEKIESDFSERQKQIITELATKNNTIELKQTQLKSLTEETSFVKNEKNLLKDEIQYLTNNRNEIIRNLRLNLEIGNSKNQFDNQQIKFYEIFKSLNNKDVWYENFEDYFDDLKIKSGIRDSEETNFEKALKALKTSKFIRSDNIYFVLNLISSIGCSKSYIQQVEGDWLKFEKWYQNGLSDIIDNAIMHPETRFFFVLEDFNLASPECYAKPIIDISNGVRKYVPGTSIKWPANLWLIFVCLESEIDDFGFEIIDDTFSNWDMLEGSRLSKLHDIEMEKCFKL